MRLYVVLFSGMARPKVPVTREEAGIEVPRPNRGRGGGDPDKIVRKEKEKENEDVKGKAKVNGHRGRLHLHDEGSNIDAGRHEDLVVARGGEEGNASSRVAVTLQRRGTRQKLIVMWAGVVLVEPAIMKESQKCPLKRVLHSPVVL
ncbi:hypothetical protein Scep_003879 [Stephania cephalantha]|uniref:Uncharacterized protein n=1 Tax=Stephania cephalantha TaxID=152367 RepID=A0AAP0KTX1_9MAGN